MIDFALESMIQQQLVSRGISDQEVIRAFRRVSRRPFVPDYLQHQAFADEVLPIGLGQTLTAPYAIARMLQELRLTPQARVLEVGTGSGFQTALLATLVHRVYTVEILPELSARARKLLVDQMRLPNVAFRVGDGFQGWSDEAPFDAVVVNAAASDVPWPLVGQLRVGGRLVMPVGERDQRLHVLSRQGDDEVVTVLPPEAFTATFGPMVGEAED